MVAGRAAFRGFSPFAMAGIMRQANLTIRELAMDKLEAMVRRAEARRFTDEDYETAKTVLQSYVHLVALLKDEKTKIHRLRKMLFGASTEKIEHLLGSRAEESAPSSAAGEGNTVSEEGSESVEEADPEEDSEPPPRKGHGRNGADAYHGGDEIRVPHESLQPGDPCPECGDGTVYETPRPGVLVRLVGSAPVEAKVYRLQKLRCHLCGKVFTAQAPAGAGHQKHDATVGSMIGLLKYGMGMPFNRFESLQGSVGIPLPASTQWDLVHTQAQRARPVFEELIRQAARGNVLYNDDSATSKGWRVQWETKPTGAIAKSPVAWMAGRRETE
jgi:transposase